MNFEKKIEHLLDKLGFGWTMVLMFAILFPIGVGIRLSSYYIIRWILS